MDESQKPVAIGVYDVSKTFKLPHEKTTSVKNLLINFRKRRTYEKQQVLKDISFEIKQGEFFGIVGRNGSGKSTLLKLLAGIYSPDNGKIAINGMLTPFIELGVGFSPELTGKENVFLNGALLGFNRKEMEDRYDEIVRFSELEKFMDQKLKNYSSGMQVRLAFSIAIQAKSDILVLDEVLAVGDIAFQKKCVDYFKQLKRDKRTVVLVSHDMGAVERHCTRALLINDGVMVDMGEPKEIAAEYRLLNLPKQKGAHVSHKLFGDVTIDSATINGKKEVIVSEDEELTVDVTFTPKKSKNFVVALSICLEDDSHVTYFDTRSADKVGKKIEGKKGKTYTTTCRFPAKSFLEGVYKVNVDLYDENEIYLGAKPDAVRFSVANTGPGKAGIINMHGDWRTKEK